MFSSQGLESVSSKAMAIVLQSCLKGTSWDVLPESALRISLRWEIAVQAPPDTLSRLLHSRQCDRRFAQKAGKICWFKHISSTSNETNRISSLQQNHLFFPKDMELTGRNAKLRCICSYTYQEGNHPSVHKSSCTAHSSKPRLGPENSYLPCTPLREHSHPQTALPKSKSANTWRSLASLFCSGETQLSQGTDIISDSMVQTSRQRDAQGLLLIRMSFPVYLFDWTFWWKPPQLSRCGPHQQHNATQSSHLNKNRFLSHTPDGELYFRKVSYPGLGPCRTWVCSHRLPNWPSVMCKTGCSFRVQAQGRNPHGGAGSEMAPGRAWQAIVRVVQGQAQGSLRVPFGPAVTISHTEQLNSCQAAWMGAAPIETPVFPLCLASSRHHFAGGWGKGRAHF